MGSIWKPTIQYEPYRGNTFYQNAHWSPAHTQELYHYGRKGMKWYKHIFGNFNLKAMGTGVGNLLDEDKVKEIARKLGIPLNQINQKMGVIREYFMRERRSQMTGNNPPAYDKTQRDAQEIKSVANAVRRQTKREFIERSNAEDRSRMGLPRTVQVFESKEEKAARKIDALKRKHDDELHNLYLEERRRKRQEKQDQEASQEAAWKQATEEKKKQRQERHSEAVHKNKVERRIANKEQQREYEMNKQLAEQRRDEEEAYRQYLKRFRKGSGGGHRF